MVAISFHFLICLVMNIFYHGWNLDPGNLNLSVVFCLPLSAAGVQRWLVSRQQQIHSTSAPDWLYFLGVVIRIRSLCMVCPFSLLCSWSLTPFVQLPHNTHACFVSMKCGFWNWRFDFPSSPACFGSEVRWYLAIKARSAAVGWNCVDTHKTPGV